MIYEFNPELHDLNSDAVEVYDSPDAIPGPGYNPFIYITYYEQQWHIVHAKSNVGHDNLNEQVDVNTFEDALSWAIQLAKESDSPIVTGGYGKPVAEPPQPA